MTHNEWISCNVCGADNFQKLSTVDGWNIGRCGKCRQIYVNPMPFFEPGDEFSNMSMDFQYTRFQHTLTPVILAHDKFQFKQHIAEMSALSGKSITTGRFLDVGCGSGATVRAAMDLGWEALGIDIDPSLTELGHRELQVDLRTTTLSDSNLTAEQFDFIRLRDVIEHLPDPYQSLLEVKRLLVPGGYLLIATPNEDALPTQVRLIVDGKRTTVATVAPPHHVHGFTPKTLARLCRRVGLSICRLHTATPVDKRYVTARNMESANNKLHVLAWRIANAIGKGSMLIAWSRKE